MGQKNFIYQRILFGENYDNACKNENFESFLNYYLYGGFMEFYRRKSYDRAAVGLPEYHDRKNT